MVEVEGVLGFRGLLLSHSCNAGMNALPSNERPREDRAGCAPLQTFGLASCGSLHGSGMGYRNNRSSRTTRGPSRVQPLSPPSMHSRAMDSPAALTRNPMGPVGAVNTAVGRM
jgi:hypothetical protein